MSCGTYDLDAFTEKENELQRLAKQAKTGISIERNLLKHMGLAPGMHALDLACGPGITSCEMAAIAGDGQVTGIDINDSLLALAHQYKTTTGTENVRFLKGNAYELDLQENTFDFVYARFLFQHLNDPMKVIRNAYRVLKPGGIMCILDVDDDWLCIYPTPPHFEELKSKAAEFQARNGGDRFVGRKLRHYLHQGGFKNTSHTVKSISSQEIGLSDFLDITTSFKYLQVESQDTTLSKECIKEMYAFAERHEVSGMVGVFAGKGIK